MSEHLPSANRVVFDLTFLEDSFDELPYYMQQKENLVKLMLVFAKRFNDVNNAAISLAYSRFVDNAEGDILKQIADRLFVAVGGQSDASLKGAIKLRSLRQDSEGTRDEIVRLLKIIIDGEYVKVFKSEKNYVEVVFPNECLQFPGIENEVIELFPINTNLVIGDVVTGTSAFGVGDVNNPLGTSPKVGVLASTEDVLFSGNTTAVIKYSDERIIN